MRRLLSPNGCRLGPIRLGVEGKGNLSELLAVSASQVSVTLAVAGTIGCVVTGKAKIATAVKGAGCARASGAVLSLQWSRWTTDRGIAFSTLDTVAATGALCGLVTDQGTDRARERHGALAALVG